MRLVAAGETGVCRATPPLKIVQVGASCAPVDGFVIDCHDSWCLDDKTCMPNQTYATATAAELACK